MLNYVVIDDNEHHRKNINDLIMSFMMKNKLEFNINNFSDYSKSTLQYIKNNTLPSVYIIDVELPNGDGIDIARKIRNEYNDWLSPIIIITAHSSLYPDVYKQRLQLLDFVSKSSNTTKSILENLKICIKMLNKNRVYRYTYNNVEYAITLDMIDYIHRDGRRIKIVAKDNTYYQNISIQKIKELLPSNFKVSTKGMIINVNNIKMIDWNNGIVYFKSGIKVDGISISHKKELMSYANK